jgi:prepilin-type N-terminal cleavage/methylation domain-containing protein
MKPITRVSKQEGFTLIELLTVIGIIVLLVAILLPVVSTVRLKAYVVNTQQQMSVIQAACQSYFHDFNAYPGPIANSSLSGAMPAIPNPKPITGLTGPITSSENLVLGLLGLLTPPTTQGGQILYTPPGTASGGTITSPHDVLSLNFINPKSYHYIDYVPNQLSPGSSIAMDYAFGSTVPPTDSKAPEFVDQIPNPMPILYVRANVGNPPAIGTGAAAKIATPDDSSQYNYMELKDYVSMVRTAGSGNPMLFTQQTLAGMYTLSQQNPSGLADDVATPFKTFDASSSANPPGYFANPNIANAPRGKDTFILISAGQDRVYGTQDDIIVTP